MVFTVIAVVGFGVGLVGVAGPASGDPPVLAITPRVPPATMLNAGGVCVVGGRPSPSAPSSVGAVTVSSSPEAVTAVWLPGLNARPCVAEITRGGTMIARALARGVDTAPKVPSGGVYHCPNDDLTEVDLYFSVVAGGSSELVVVDPSGCGFLSAPGRSPRTWRTGPLFGHELALIAPSAWRRYLDN